MYGAGQGADPELIEDGLAREFVSKLQNMRKAADLEVTQRIHVRFSGDEAVQAAVARYEDYIKTETLSLTCEGVAGAPEGATE